MAKEEKEEIVNLRSRVEVKATDKHPFADKGEIFEVHPKVAEKFLKDGFIEKYKGIADEDSAG